MGNELLGSVSARSSVSPEGGYPELLSSSSSTARSSMVNMAGTQDHQSQLDDDNDWQQDHQDNLTKSLNAKRKRKRLTISCLTCRRRKIKCDRQKPCSSCIKNNVPAHLCVYDSSPWVSTLIKDNKMTDELLSLKQENSHLNDLLKMNEMELNNLKSLLLDLKIGQPRESVKREASPTEIVEFAMTEEEQKEDFLLDQPINIGLFSCFRKTKFLVKLFGPGTWQNFVMADSRTSYMLESNIPYVMDLISVNTRRLKQRQVAKLSIINDRELDEAKLNEIAEYLGNYDTVAQNINFFESIHQTVGFLKFVDDEVLIRNFNKLIRKDPATGNCSFNLDLNSPTSHIDVANLASILLILKISIVCQDKTFEIDMEEKLVNYAAQLFSSRVIMEQPSVPAVLALAIFETYQLYNPIDFGAEIIPHGTSRDYSTLLTIAISSALKLGIHTSLAQNYEKGHYNYISPYHLREFWRSVLVMDFITSIQSGLPLAMSGYSDILERTDESILMKISNENDVTFTDFNKHRKIVALRSSAYLFSTTNQSTNKMRTRKDLVHNIYILKKMVVETRLSEDQLLSALDRYRPELIEDLLTKSCTLDVLITTTFTLFSSLALSSSSLNSNLDKLCFQKHYQQQNFMLVKRYYNATLLYSVYLLRFCAWFFERVYSDSYWTDNLVLQFLVVKLLKQVAIKSSVLVLISLIKNLKVEPGKSVWFESKFNQPKAEFFDIFKAPFDKMDELVWSEIPYEKYNFESSAILTEVLALNVRLFKSISTKKTFLTIDRKWYISMELAYTSLLYCFRKCPVVKAKFNYKDIDPEVDDAFRNFYNQEDVAAFRSQNYQKNKNEIMKVTSLLN